MENVVAVILGGGRGTRLFPLTHQRAKPAVPLFGKYRLIDVPLANCINSSVHSVFVLTQFLSASLHRHIMHSYRFGPFSKGFVQILAAEQTQTKEAWFQGTADAVRATLHHIHHYKRKETLILSGDHLYRMDYRDLIQFHREQGADITLAVHPVVRAEASRMGLLRASTEGVVHEFVEKPTEPEVIERFKAPDEICVAAGLPAGSERYLASMGIYVFEQHVLDKLLSGAENDFGSEIIPGAIDEFKVAAFPFNGYWADIGTTASFFEANIEATRPNPPFPLFAPNAPIYTRARNLGPARVIQSTIQDSLLCEGSDIQGAVISDSIVGVRSIIQPGATMKETVMLGADYFEAEANLSREVNSPEALPPIGIGRNCHLERCILDKNVRIGDGVIITRKSPDVNIQGEQYWVADGITVIPKGAVIPAGTIV